jgi:hypothetical protein
MNIICDRRNIRKIPVPVSGFIRDMRINTSTVKSTCIANIKNIINHEEKKYRNVYLKPLPKALMASFLGDEACHALAKSVTSRNTGRMRKNIPPVIKSIFGTSEPDPPVASIISGKPIIRKEIRLIISLTSSEMTRNDQKFDEDAPKKPLDLISLSFLLRTSKNPPLRKILSRKVINIKIIIPEIRNDLTSPRPMPVFASTSIFNPLLSFSVIMLDPSIFIIPDLKGYATVATSTRVINQVIRIHFHDLADLTAPESI